MRATIRWIAARRGAGALGILITLSQPVVAQTPARTPNAGDRTWIPRLGLPANGSLIGRETLSPLRTVMGRSVRTPTSPVCRSNPASCRVSALARGAPTLPDSLTIRSRNRHLPPPPIARHGPAAGTHHSGYSIRRKFRPVVFSRVATRERLPRESRTPKERLPTVG